MHPERTDNKSMRPSNRMSEPIMPNPAEIPRKRYRIDFALIVLTGNATRYQITRPLVEQDSTVASRWFPIRTWFQEDPLRFLPGKIRILLRHFLDTRQLFFSRPADAIVIHAFETYYLYVFMQVLLRRHKVVIVKNPDGGLIAAPPSTFLQRLKWNTTVARTDIFVPWSNRAAAELRTAFPDLPSERLVVLHPGIDLSRWQMRSPVEPQERFRLLFVGGDLVRKGADTLLEAFEKHLTATCDLHLCTQSAWLSRHPELAVQIENLPHVHLHADLTAGSPELVNLFQTCDAFVLPTKDEGIPWVAMEALATGIPTIMCPVGGIPDVIIDGETGLHIPVRDPDAVAACVERLRASPGLCRRLAEQGRRHIELHYDAAKNTQQLLAIIKRLVDQRERSS